MPKFKYEAGTNVFQSCSISLNGHMLIFGGDDDSTPDYSRQILEVGACGLTKIGLLPFDFEFGACNSFLAKDNTQHALLCFDWAADKDCHT